MKPECFSVVVIICTKDRPESLLRTLRSLAAADRIGIRVRLVVVNNGGQLVAAEHLSVFPSDLPLQLVHEERTGKGHALNRGLRECGDAEIVAVLDDDITVEAGWFAGMREITTRWPDKGFFGGSTSVAWPSDRLPPWAGEPSLTGWAFSAVATSKDRCVSPGQWVSGNHFWFRARLLSANYQFPDHWNPEPPLMLDLAERGFGGVIGPEAIAWHHVQPDLLRVDVLRDRARMVGRTFAEARLKPYRKSIKQAALFHRYPLLSRVFCYVNAARWFCLYHLAVLSPRSDKRVLREFEALERLAAYRQYAKVSKTCSEYRWRKASSDKL